MAEDHVFGAAHLLLDAQHSLTSRMADCEQPVQLHVDWKKQPPVHYHIFPHHCSGKLATNDVKTNPVFEQPTSSCHSAKSTYTQRTTYATLMRASSLASKRGLSIITLPLGRFTRYEALPKLSCEM